MVSKNKTESLIDTAKPHTVKKFDLIEEYVKSWAQKLMNYQKCNGIVFIDCMCNSGVYKDIDGNDVLGTPIRVAKVLSDIMQSYLSKQAWLFFSDFEQEKIDLLKTKLPGDTKNFHITSEVGDGNELIKRIGSTFHQAQNINFLLLYDPYKATVDWSALRPFFLYWGEVIINHMVSDSIRGVTQAKSAVAVKKYEETYLASITDLITFGSDREAYENRVQEIVIALRGNIKNRYYIASFPFFNRRNALVYSLLHCGSSLIGFKLFKTTAWKTFGGKSSAKDTHGLERQYVLDVDGSGEVTTMTDDYCYYISDIAKYVHTMFRGRAGVPFDEVWALLDEHPVFPSDGYKNEIKNELKSAYGDTVKRSTITFNEGGI